MASDWQQENLKGAIQLGAQAIKSLELINGGAAIGILTFYGNLLSRDDPGAINKTSIKLALYCFGAGVAFSAIAGTLGYVSQLIAATQPGWRSEIVLRYVAIGAGFTSLLAFCIGVSFSACSFG